MRGANEAREIGSTGGSESGEGDTGGGVGEWDTETSSSFYKQRAESKLEQAYAG